MEITVQIKNVYGNETVYVVSESHKKALEVLTGQKTLTQRNIGALKDLGFTFKVQPQSL